ncbi:MAG: hypothetical protein ACRDGH_04540 [Candidatus Limnocylindria bacterium]
MTKRSPHPRSGAGIPDMHLGDGPLTEPYVKHASAKSPVPTRTATTRGPCESLADQSNRRTRAFATTPGLREEVNARTATGEPGRPSAAYGSISYEERQARARRGR